MFSKTVAKKAMAHALAEWPRESVGAVIGNKYESIENIAETPEEDFAVSSDDMLDIATRGYQALVHSHPQGQEAPSALDMQAQQSGDVPWGIVVIHQRSEGAAIRELFWFGDQVKMEPLIGRTFRHGVADCYALFRDWHRENTKMVLPDFPRSDGWWSHGGNFIEETLPQLDHENISRSDVAPGDMLIMAVQSSTPNHIGVYLGNGLMLHHLAGRLSRREPVNTWYKQIQRIVRVHGAKA